MSVFAPVFSPYYPALPHVVGDRVYEGTYANPQGDALPSRVFQYSAGGVPLRSYTVPGQDLSQPHGVQVAATDAQGRLLLLDRTSGRILRLDPASGAFTQYSQVPDLPLCSAAPSGEPTARRPCWTRRRCPTTPRGDRTARCTSPTISRR